jgi:hypothetical protein
MKTLYLLSVIALVGLMAGSVAASDDGPFEYKTDRPGSDFRDFDLPDRAGPKECLVACEQDDQCVAFTYVRAGVQGQNPRCWLKNRIPDAVPSDCCVSGVKGNDRAAGPEPEEEGPPPPPNERPLQYGVNLHGSDYRDFDMEPGATPQMCRDTCEDEDQCRAFTYVKAGVQGGTPHCWLKNTVPQAYSDERCVSGVKE